MSMNKGVTDSVRSIGSKINNSASLAIAFFGAALISIGAIIQTGVVPALLAIWGVALIAIGLTSYAIIWYIRQ